MNREKFREIHDLLMEQLDVSRELSDEEILEVIDELILNQSKELFFSLKEKVGLRQELFCSVRKLDVLQELIEDESVTEIMVNGPDNLKLTSPGFLDVLYGNPFGICAMTVCMGIYGLSYWLGVKIVDIEV